MSKDYAKEYALALMDLALETNILDSMKNELEIIHTTIEENDLFMKFLAHPQVSAEEKKMFIQKVYQGMSTTLIDFLSVVVDNGRTEEISEMNEEFIRLYNEYNKVLHVVAETTVLLDDNQKNQLSGKLSVKYRHKIEIENILNPSIYGGIRLTIHNEVIDQTIKSQIQNLKTHILKQI